MVKYYVNESGVYKIVKFTQTEYYIIIESFEQLISTPNVQSIPAEHVDNEKYFFDSETVARQHYMIFIELHYRMLLYQRNTLVEKVENLVYNEVQKQISALLHFNID